MKLKIDQGMVNDFYSLLKSYRHYTYQNFCDDMNAVLTKNSNVLLNKKAPFAFILQHRTGFGMKCCLCKQAKIIRNWSKVEKHWCEVCAWAKLAEHIDLANPSSCKVGWEWDGDCSYVCIFTKGYAEISNYKGDVTNPDDIRRFIRIVRSRSNYMMELTTKFGMVCTNQGEWKK